MSVTEAMAEAIATAHRAHPDPNVANGMVTKWIVVFEVIEAEGDRGLGVIHDDDQAMWEREGMLRYALAATVGYESPNEPQEDIP